MLNLKNKSVYTQMLFAGALAVMLMTVVSTDSAEAKSHKKLANIQTSQSDHGTINGASSKAERSRPKHQRLNNDLFDQDLNSGNGMDLVSG